MQITPEVFGPYGAGAVALALGIRCKWQPMQRVRGIGALVLFSPVLVAVAMAVFGADHLAAPRAVANFVPAWMPWHLFWAVLVGVALVAAAISLATGILATWATGLLGTMILGFALMIFLPAWLTVPGNRMLTTLLLRDLTLGSAYLAFAVHVGFGPDRHRAFVTVARWVIATAVAVYGVQQLLHPDAAPGIPQDGKYIVTMPEWMPAHAGWAYATGVIYILGALALLQARYARNAAMLLGLTTGVVILLAYVPLTIAKAADVEHGLNYLAIHLALAGAFFLLAAASPDRSRIKAAP